MFFKTVSLLARQTKLRLAREKASDP